MAIVHQRWDRKSGVSRQRQSADPKSPLETSMQAGAPDDGPAMTGAERLAIFACLGAVTTAVLLPSPATKLILGGGLGLVFLLISLRHFYIAIAFFAFFLPLQSLLPQESFFVRGLNLETLFVLGFWALSAFNGRGSATNTRPRNVVTTPLLCFIAVMGLSAIHSVVLKGSAAGDMFADLKTALVYSVFVFFTFKNIRTDRERMYVLAFLLIVITLVAAKSMQSILGDGGAFNPARHRATSLILAQPNLWGGFLAMYSFFFFTMLLYARLSPLRWVVTFLAAGVVLVNLAYTQSRGAWLALAATALMVGGMKSRKLLVPLVAVGSIVYLLTPSAAIERFRGGFEGEYDPSLLLKQNEEDEAATRVIQWRTFVPMLSHYGITGAGFGQYSKAFEQAGFGRMTNSPHSTPIQIGVEQGVLGLAVYLWLFSVVYRRAAALLKEAGTPVARTLALGLIACTVCVLLLDLSGTRSRTGTLMLFYWIIAGMTLNIPLRSDAPSGVAQQEVPPGAAGADRQSDRPRRRAAPRHSGAGPYSRPTRA